jgi:transposase
MIRIDTIWLTTEPMDMRASTGTALARGVAVFGAAKPHCAYLFANRRANA